MKTILAELNSVINSLEKQGFSKEASDLNSVFMKIAQTDIDEQSPRPLYDPNAPMAKPKPKKTMVGGDVYGRKARKATQELKAALGIPGDESWGPNVAKQIKRIYDGARIKKQRENKSVVPYNQFDVSYDPGYANAAVAAFDAAGPVKNKIMNNDFVYNLADAVDKSGETHSIAQPGAMSAELIKLLIMLSSYQRD
jgi:hypothetical protein